MALLLTPEGQSSISRPTKLDRVTISAPIAMPLITQATDWYSFFCRNQTSYNFFCGPLQIMNFANWTDPNYS